MPGLVIQIRQGGGKTAGELEDREMNTSPVAIAGGLKCWVSA